MLRIELVRKPARNNTRKPGALFAITRDRWAAVSSTRPQEKTPNKEPPTVMHSSLVKRCLFSSLLAFAFLSFTSPLARAAIVYSGTNFQIDVSSPIAVGTNLQAVTITATGLNGAKPNAIDASTGGMTGITTIGPLMHQVFQAGLVPSPTETNAFAAVPQDIDSHFMVLDSEILPVSAPTEDGTANPAEHLFGRFGTLLKGSFTLFGTPQTTWDIAYIVTPANTVVNLNFKLADGTGQALEETVDVGFTIVPEPSSVALAGCGAISLAYAVFRRRRSHR